MACVLAWKSAFMMERNGGSAASKSCLRLRHSRDSCRTHVSALMSFLRDREKRSISCSRLTTQVHAPPHAADALSDSVPQNRPRSRYDGVKSRSASSLHTAFNGAERGVSAEIETAATHVKRKRKCSMPSSTTPYPLRHSNTMQRVIEQEARWMQISLQCRDSSELGHAEAAPHQQDASSWLVTCRLATAGPASSSSGSTSESLSSVIVHATAPDPSGMQSGDAVVEAVEPSN